MPCGIRTLRSESLYQNLTQLAFLFCFSGSEASLKAGNETANSSPFTFLPAFWKCSIKQIVDTLKSQADMAHWELCFLHAQIKGLRANFGHGRVAPRASMILVVMNRRQERDCSDPLLIRIIQARLSVCIYRKVYGLPLITMFVVTGWVIRQ